MKQLPLKVRFHLCASFIVFLSLPLFANPAEVTWRPLEPTSWVRGASPSFSNKRARLSLKPGEQTVLRLDRRDLVRLELKRGVWAGENSAAGVSVWVASEDGVFLRFPAPTRKSWVVTAQQARFLLLQQTGEACDIQLYRGRLANPYESLRWQVVAGSSKAGMLRDQDGGVHEGYRRVTPEHPLTLTVSAGQHLRIDSRALLYAGENHKNYHLHTFLDDRASGLWMEYAPHAADLQWVNVAKQSASVTNRRRRYLTVPEGTQTVRLQPTSPVLLRVAREQGDSLLLGKWNRVVDQTEGPAEAFPQPAWWSHRPENPYQERVRRIFATAMDAQQREAGLAAAADLDRWAVGQEVDLWRWSQRFRRHVTFSRRLRPTLGREADGTLSQHFRLADLPMTGRLRLSFDLAFAEGTRRATVFLGDGLPHQLLLQAGAGDAQPGPVAVELAVPAGTTDLKLLLPKDVAAQVAVAHGRTPRLDGDQVRFYAQQLNQPLFSWFLEGRPLPETTAEPYFAAWLLRRHFQTLQDLIAVNSSDAENTVALPAASASPETGNSRRRRAEALEQRDDLRAALPLRRALAVEYGGADALALVRLLHRMGEHVLAKKQAHALVQNDPNPDVRRRAWSHLAQFYRAYYDGRFLVGLTVDHFTREENTQSLTRLVQVFLERGEHNAALDALYLLPEPDSRLAAQVALHGDLGLLQSVCDQMPAAEGAFYRGQAALSAGLLDDALRLLTEAGSTAGEQQAYVAALRALSRPAVNRDDLLNQWQNGESLRAATTGSRRQSLVAEVVGGETRTLYQAALDRTREAVQIARDQTVSLQVMGPRRIQISLRPLVPASGEAGYSGTESWQNGGLTWLPEAGRRPVAHNRLLGDSRRVGPRVVHEFEVGPGVHHLAWRPRGGDVLLRVKQDVVPLLDQRLRQIHADFSARIQAPGAALLSEHETAHQLLRQPELNPSERTRLGELIEFLPEEQAGLAYFRAHRDGPIQRRFSRRQWALTQDPAQKLALQSAAGKPFTPSDDLDPVQQMQALQRDFVRGKRRQAALAHAALLVEQHRENPRVRSLFAPFKKQTIWQVLRAVDDFAGVRPIESALPANPFLYTRETLLGATDRDTVRLWPGQSQSFVAARNTLRFPKVRLRAVHPAKASAVTIRVRFDRGPFHELLVQPDGQSWFQADLPVPRGAQRLEIQLAESSLNQALEIDCNPKVLLCEPEKARLFMAATPQQPLTLRLFEPTWLRVETLDGRSTHVDYHFVTDTPTTFTLVPQKGRKQSFYRLAARLFRRADETEAIENPPQLTPVRAFAALAASNDPEPVDWDEAFLEPTVASLGTWDVALLARRLEQPLDEEQGRRNDDSQSLHLTWRRRSGAHAWRVRALLRDRADDALTLGLEARYGRRLAGGLFEAHGRAFTQQAELAHLGGRDERAWSAEFGARWQRSFPLREKWRQRFRVTAFARELSLENLDRVQADAVDFSVYTRYRDQHRSGLRLDHRFAYTPFADSRFTLNLGISGNEDWFSLDSAGYRVGWDQLMGAYEFNLFSSGRHFFSDDHRTRALQRHRHGFEINRRLQRRGAKRWEAGLRFTVNDDGRVAGWLLLSHAWGAPGNYQHYDRNELLFRRLKSDLNQQAEVKP